MKVIYNNIISRINTRSNFITSFYLCLTVTVTLNCFITIVNFEMRLGSKSEVLTVSILLLGSVCRVDCQSKREDNEDARLSTVMFHCTLYLKGLHRLVKC